MHVGYAHVLRSYALRQHIKVNLFGRDGWGNIGPGWSSFAEESVVSCLRIVFPCCVVVGGEMLSSKLLLALWVLPAVGLRGIRLLVVDVPFARVLFVGR